MNILLHICGVCVCGGAVSSGPLTTRPLTAIQHEGGGRQNVSDLNVPNTQLIVGVDGKVSCAATHHS